MAAQIVGQLLDNKFDRISHLRFLHLQGEGQMGSKCLIYMRIYPETACEVTDSGNLFSVPGLLQVGDHFTVNTVALTPKQGDGFSVTSAHRDVIDAGAPG